MTASPAREAFPPSFDVIYATTNGSRLYGTATEESDWDFMGVFKAPREQIIGLDTLQDSRVRRNRSEHERSTAETVETTEYEVRKALGLLLGGNPNIVPILFAPEEQVQVLTEEGALFRTVGRRLLTRDLGKKFYGMTVSQLKRLQGTGTKMNTMPNRPELVERYGYDTKYAATAFRTAVMGRELLETGSLQLPLKRADEVLAMRQGASSLEEAVALTEAELALLDAAEEGSPLPTKAARHEANALLLDFYGRA